MVLTSYEFDISDFAGEVNPEELKEAILNSNIQSTYNHVTIHGDVYNIIFDTELSDTDEETLTTIVNNHSESNSVVYSYITKSHPLHDYIDTTLYTKVDNFTYPGTNYGKLIGKIVLLAFMDADVTSFSVIISDETNHNIICEKTFTNTEENTMLDMGTISNIPNNESIIEISIKKTGGLTEDRVYLEGTTIYYI